MAEIYFPEEIIRMWQDAQNKTRVDISNYFKTHRDIDIDTVKKIMWDNYYPDNSDDMLIISSSVNAYLDGSGAVCFVISPTILFHRLQKAHIYDGLKTEAIRNELFYQQHIFVDASKVSDSYELWSDDYNTISL